MTVALEVGLVDPALWEVLREEAEDDEVEALIRLADETTLIPGVRVVSRFGSIATCRIPPHAILEVRGRKELRA